MTESAANEKSEHPALTTTEWITVAEELSRAMTSVDGEAFSALTRALEAHDGRWFVDGVGRSGLVARMFAMRLVHLGLQVHIVGEATAPALGPRDGYWAISNSGNTESLLAHARRAREAGAVVVAMTTAPDSPLALLADILLQIPKPTTIQIPGSPAELAALALTDALVLRLTGADPSAYAQMAQIHANLE